MRTPDEMFSLILTIAREDDHIRAAWLEGSRTDPDAPPDIFQDYDVEFVVDDTAPYREDTALIDRFGPRLFMQLPEAGVLFPSDPEACWGWLVQLADGNRVDLHVCTLPHALATLGQEYHWQPLLDKDGILPLPGPPRRHTLTPPTQAVFSSVCNEFWWCLDNVAKGLWRGEVLYALDMLGDIVRPQARRLLAWTAGTMAGFDIVLGKSDKYLGSYLPPALWQGYLASYTGADVQAVWDGVFALCDTVERAAPALARHFGFTYNLEEACQARAYLAHVRALPGDALQVY